MTIRKGPTPKHPCPKCAGRMIRETIGGRTYLECQNVDCGGRVLLDRKAPSNELYQVPEQPDKKVRRGPRGPNRTPMTEEARRRISQGMREAHAKRKGLPMPAPSPVMPTPTSVNVVAPRSSHIETAHEIDRFCILGAARTDTVDPTAPQVQHRQQSEAERLLARMIETLEAQIEELTLKVKTLRQAMDIMVDISAA